MLVSRLGYFCIRRMETVPKLDALPVAELSKRAMKRLNKVEVCAM